MFLSNALRSSYSKGCTTASAHIKRSYMTSTNARQSRWVMPASMLASAGLGAAYVMYGHHPMYGTSRAYAEGSSNNAPAAFSPEEFREFTLVDVMPINHNTSRFRFKLPDDSVSGLHVASCIFTRHRYKKPDGSEGSIMRPYTPTSDEGERGYVDFVIKDYPQGKMSRHIHLLKPGDKLEIKGPIPKYNWDQGKKEHVGMIAGGTGITPMLQLLRKIFGPSSKDNNTKVTLIFGNQTEEDIILKKELDSYAKSFPDRFKVVYAVDKPTKNWDGHHGYVTAELIKKHLPNPEQSNSIIFVCGPDAMLASLAGPKAPDKSQGKLDGILKEMGYPQDHVYKF
ncbi:hypothetical protein O0I10_010319 [Lichtheimia ornata]|uniref:NADH-cytochrome b5 reductase n=1 Tax=Lichtheimia ornata TaxID=688661 RepID=A0AAD7UVM6_9FUNG|nr:uncharacterized protein O0I10_010319 [Lichtheimia ornata]KAJ8653983.1 hypothetical protein O0I10_010319 [Lichtheimia ornata]